MAVAAEFLWRPNERHMEEDTDAVHILPTYELNPVMVAVSSLSGMKSGSQCMRLAVGENRTCFKLFVGLTAASVGPTPASGPRCQLSRIGFTLRK